MIDFHFRLFEMTILIFCSLKLSFHRKNLNVSDFFLNFTYFHAHLHVEHKSAIALYFGFSEMKILIFCSLKFLFSRKNPIFYILRISSFPITSRLIKMVVDIPNNDV